MKKIYRFRQGNGARLGLKQNWTFLSINQLGHLFFMYETNNRWDDHELVILEIGDDVPDGLIFLGSTLNAGSTVESLYFLKKYEGNQNE